MPESQPPQICAACQQPFRCGAATADCWCSQITLSAATRRHLAQRYQACLCRACLEQAAAQEHYTPGFILKDSRP